MGGDDYTFHTWEIEHDGNKFTAQNGRELDAMVDRWVTSGHSPSTIIIAAIPLMHNAKSVVPGKVVLDPALLNRKVKTLEWQFAEWFHHVFGFCYGSGETAILGSLQAWFNCLLNDQMGEKRSHDYRIAEGILGPAIEWFIVNALCRADIMEYGTSPRFGWLTEQGEALGKFIRERTVDHLLDICDVEEMTDLCEPRCCQCSGKRNGSEPCTNNAFWAG